MADTTVASGLTVQRWDAKFYRQFLAQNLFTKEIGRSENSIIQIKEDLTKQKGDSITYALINRLTGAGVTGSNTLEGNEEAMDSRSFKVTVQQLRHAVRVASSDEQFSAIPLRDAAKLALMDWKMEEFRDRIIAEFGSINGVAYGSATEAQKDAWLVDNSDRVLFGNAVSNNSSNDHSASLANIDNTNDKLTASNVSLMQRIAMTASPKIRPVRTGDGQNWYVLYTGVRCFRDLREDSVMQQAMREALPRGKGNPLFAGGDLIWDQVIIKQVADFPVVTGVGAGSIDVQRAVLTGAQAIAYGVAKRTKTSTKSFDYGDKQGVSVAVMDKVAKMTFGSGSSDTADLKDNGMVTGWFAGVAD